MTTIAVIQARSGSTRLPGKIFADIEGMPMLERVVHRARLASTLHAVAVATTILPEDDRVARLCRDMDVACTRGSVNDVLSRYAEAAQQLGADVIVRITSDCPLIDPSVIDRVVRAFRARALDYASNTLVPTYPDGLDTEVFSVGALNLACREAALGSEREHVTPFIKTRPNRFRLVNVTNDEDMSALRWTVDEPADLDFATRAYRLMGTSDFGYRELVDALATQPDITALNAHYERNAGYTRSLENDAHARMIERS